MRRVDASFVALCVSASFALACSTDTTRREVTPDSGVDGGREAADPDAASPDSEVPSVSPVVSEHFTLSLETTPCFGRCSVYQLSVDDTGSVLFNGKACASEPGFQSGELTPEAARSFYDELNELGFFDLASGATPIECAEKLTDGPHANWLVEADDSSYHLVRDEGCTGNPTLSALDDLQARILDAAGLTDASTSSVADRCEEQAAAVGKYGVFDGYELVGQIAFTFGTFPSSVTLYSCDNQLVSRGEVVVTKDGLAVVPAAPTPLIIPGGVGDAFSVIHIDAYSLGEPGARYTMRAVDDAGERVLTLDPDVNCTGICDAVEVDARPAPDDPCRLELNSNVAELRYLVLQLDGAFLETAAFTLVDRTLTLHEDACAVVSDGQAHSLRVDYGCPRQR